MAKSNPLFVDSTLLHGDRIGTQIELNKILVYESETVVVSVTNHLGEVQLVAMRPLEETGYQAKVWLSHQKLIRLQFSVEQDGKTLWRSPTYEVRAQYAILNDWEPDLRDPGEVPITTPAPAPTPRPHTTPDSSRLRRAAELFTDGRLPNRKVGTVGVLNKFRKPVKLGNL